MMARVGAGLCLLWLSSASACSQESFLLGGVNDAGAPRSSDAEALDAASDAKIPLEPSPMSVTIEARGHERVVGLAVGCGADCVEVRVAVSGGEPPYQILWDDGRKGAVRPLCADPTRARGGIVQDASGGVNAPVSFSVGIVDHLSCNEDSATHRTCFTPPSLSGCADVEGYPMVVDLGASFATGAHASAEFVGHGIPPSGPIYGYALSETCEGGSRLNGSYEYLDPEGETSRLLFDLRFASETRYLALEGPYFPGLFVDAGGGFEVESAVVCEYTGAGG